MPSVKTGPIKCCMLGVRRNGTVSTELQVGWCATEPERRVEICAIIEMLSVHTWEQFTHGDKTRSSRDGEAGRISAIERECIRQEARRGGLQSKLFPHAPKFARTIHSSKHVLRRIQ